MGADAGSVDVERVVRGVVEGALRAIGAEAALELRAWTSHGRAGVRVVLSPPKSGALPARRWGQVAHALQVLCEAALVQAGRAEAPVEVLLPEAPAEGRPPPVREDAGLVQAARALAETSARLGRAFALGPMTVADRRQVHQALGDVPEVWTQSEGEGIFRRLWIVPRRILATRPSAAGDAAREGGRDDSLA